MILIKEQELHDLIGYIHNLLDFIDVDDFEDTENKDTIDFGYKNFVEPIIQKLEQQKNNFYNGYAVTLKLNEINPREIYPSVIEKEYVYHKGFGFYKIGIVANTKEEAIKKAKNYLKEYKEV